MSTIIKNTTLIYNTDWFCIYLQKKCVSEEFVVNWSATLAHKKRKIGREDRAGFAVCGYSADCGLNRIYRHYSSLLHSDFAPRRQDLCRTETQFHFIGFWWFHAARVDTVWKAVKGFKEHKCNHLYLTPIKGEISPKHIILYHFD